jgi:hypothetical protein
MCALRSTCRQRRLRKYHAMQKPPLRTTSSTASSNPGTYKYMIFQQMSNIISCCHTCIPTTPYEGQRQTVVRTFCRFLVVYEMAATVATIDTTCLLRMLQQDFMHMQRDAGRECWLSVRHLVHALHLRYRKHHGCTLLVIAQEV